MASKYWVANNPNSEITDAKAQKLAELSATSVTLAELNALDTEALVGDAVTLTSTAAAEGGSHEIDVTYQFTDSAGANVSGVQIFDVFLADDAAGATINTDTGYTLSATTGTLLAVTANKHYKCITNASGAFVFRVLQSGSHSVYLIAQTPDGSIDSQVVTHA